MSKDPTKAVFLVYTPCFPGVAIIGQSRKAADGGPATDAGGFCELENPMLYIEAEKAFEGIEDPASGQRRSAGSQVQIQMRPLCVGTGGAVLKVLPMAYFKASEQLESAHEKAFIHNRMRAAGMIPV